MIRNYASSATVLTLLSGAFLIIGFAVAQTGPLEVQPLALVFSAEKRVRINEKGPSDILQAKVTLQAQGDLGWHTHPGPAIVAVTKGALTQYHANGCITLHRAGTAMYEPAGVPHRVVNHDTNVAAEAYATFILPTGRQPIEPAPEPRKGTCSTDPHGEKDETN